MNKLLLLVLFSNIIVFTATAQNILSQQDYTKNYIKLTSHLCEDLSTEQEKAKAIYDWITKNIKYDYKAIQNNNTTTYTCDQILKRKKGICKDYTTLFVAMCKRANLEAEEIIGYTKNWQFDNGDELFEPNHAWAAVRINNEWQLVDPTKGSGYLDGRYVFPKNILQKINKKRVYYTKHKKFVFSYDSAYFAQNPESFRLESIPADPIWQLTDTTMPIKTFATGTNAVIVFNEDLSNPMNKNPEIDKYLSSNEYAKTLSSANRSMQFNPNYKGKMIDKYFLDADVYMDNLHLNKKYKDSALIALENSTKILNEQKADFTRLYTKLKQRNTEKKQLTMQYKQALQQPSKQFYARSNRNVERCEKKIRECKEKAENFKGNNLLSSYTTITPSANTVATKSIELEVEKLQAKIKSTETEYANDLKKLNSYLQGNDQILDSLKITANKAIKALQGEINKRGEMFDMYDDEVINYMNEVKKYKQQDLDSLQNLYNSSFDSICNINMRLNLSQTALLTNYKQKVKYLEQLKKNGMAADNEFSTTSILFKDAKFNWANTNAELINFYTSAKAKNKAINKLQNAFVEAFYYIKKTENYRTKFHKKSIKTYESFDKVINKKNVEQVKAWSKLVKNTK